MQSQPVRRKLNLIISDVFKTSFYHAYTSYSLSSDIALTYSITVEALNCVINLPLLHVPKEICVYDQVRHHFQLKVHHSL